MRYAVLKLWYDCEPGEEEYKFKIKTEILRICHTFDGAYDFVEKWYNEAINEKYVGEVVGQLERRDRVAKKFDKGRNPAWCAVVEQEWDMKYVTKIYIQAIDETTQM